MEQEGQMKPAGADRDREIAEIRGDKPECIPEPWKSNEHAICSRAISCDVCTKKRDKPYSTDIAAAFELWEEMKAWARKQPHAYDGEIASIQAEMEGTLCILWTELTTPIYYRAETEADAISGAWLKWKEGK
jgi:hypothetical protein